MASNSYELRAPQSTEEWDAYHSIRRHVLFELRGQGHIYDPHHPDETRANHFPLLLLHKAEPLGVVRIDVAPPEAIVRRVAIRADRQRQGHGSVLLTLAEAFAAQHSCTELVSSVAPDAVPFYLRLGFTAVPTQNSSESLLMTKHIATSK
jgi:GNAT superfamily N-acetyltransferase